MNGEIYNNYVEILRTELIPALGCTEPIALAGCLTLLFNNISQKSFI